ncbi:MAG: hypothetical protein WAV15_00145 [Minisyncoccia bacterium]
MKKNIGTLAVLILLIIPVAAYATTPQTTNACPPVDCPGDVHYDSMETVLATGSSPVGKTVSSEGWWSDVPAVTLSEQKAGSAGEVRVIAGLPVRPTGVMYLGVRGDGVVMYYADKELRMAIAKPFLQILGAMQEIINRK